MWKTKKNNIICSYLEAYENQKKHIERVISAKEMTKSNIAPYYPTFLKLKLCKHQMEEDKNDKIKEENKILLFKIIKAEEKPSKYSQIYKPKKCPAFDKDLIYFKRIKKEIQNYKENVRFYNKIENIGSYYNNEELKQRSKILDVSSKLMKKSIFDISPSLLFLSPSRIKKEVDKYNLKRSNSTIVKRRPKSSIHTVQNSSKKSRRIEGNKNVEKNEISKNDGFLGPILEDDEEKNKGKENNGENIKKNSKIDFNNNSYMSNTKKLNNSGNKDRTSKINKIDNKDINKRQRPKSALRRMEVK